MAKLAVPVASILRQFRNGERYPQSGQRTGTGDEVHPKRIPQADAYKYRFMDVDTLTKYVNRILVVLQPEIDYIINRVKFPL